MINFHRLMMMDEVRIDVAPIHRTNARRRHRTSVRHLSTLRFD